MLPLLRIWRFRFALIGCIVAISPTTRGALPEQSICTSRQFIVYGTDVALRGAVCDLAERAKLDLLLLLGQRDSWITPIVINAQYPQANVPDLPRTALTFSQTGSGLKLQLDLTIDLNVSRLKVRRELLRALLLEIMSRGETNIPAGTSYSSPPDWLLDGVPAHSSNLPVEIADVQALPLAMRTLLPLEKFLQQRPELLDAPAQSLHRACSLALVDLLVRAPAGPDRLTRFVRDLPSAANDPMADLCLHFPGLFESKMEAEKAWQKQIARLSTPQPHQLLGTAATERILEETLRFKMWETGAPKTLELAQFPKWVKHPSAKPILKVLFQNLSALALRANPTYRPIIFEYRQIAATLIRGKTEGIARRLERVTASRKNTATQMRKIDDYLNWFEATKLRDPSEAFADYFKAAESAARPKERKRDPISVYLDAVETQFQD